MPGAVVRQVGDRVTSADVVARTELPGKVHLLNLANALGALPDELAGKLVVQPGGAVTKGAPLAKSVSFFGLFKHTVASPITGTLESVSAVTGQAVLREPPVPVEVRAYVDGEVVEILGEEGVVVETEAAPRVPLTGRPRAALPILKPAGAALAVPVAAVATVGWPR